MNHCKFSKAEFECIQLINDSKICHFREETKGGEKCRFNENNMCLSKDAQRSALIMFMNRGKPMSEIARTIP